MFGADPRSDMYSGAAEWRHGPSGEADRSLRSVMTVTHMRMEMVIEQPHRVSVRSDR